MSSAEKLRITLRCQQQRCICMRPGPKGSSHCPAHDDRHPSLSVGPGRDEKVLVHCHAGCSQDAVITALRSKGVWHGG